MEAVFFFDTYAIIEIIKGNPKYEAYRSAQIVISIFNVVELHYVLLREFSAAIADSLVEKYAPFVLQIDLSMIKEANILKLQHRSKKLSTADVIGYTAAQHLGIPFLTGDEDFKNMPNVEFIKK